MPGILCALVRVKKIAARAYIMSKESSLSREHTKGHFFTVVFFGCKNKKSVLKKSVLNKSKEEKKTNWSKSSMQKDEKVKK